VSCAIIKLIFYWLMVSSIDHVFLHVPIASASCFAMFVCVRFSVLTRSTDDPFSSFKIRKKLKKKYEI
jgi:hypothetical protein